MHTLEAYLGLKDMHLNLGHVKKVSRSRIINLELDGSWVVGFRVGSINSRIQDSIIIIKLL